MTKGSGTHGGAINCWEWCSPTIRRCILISNRATSRGGAFNGHRSSAKLINCLMAWNWSSEYGGAVNSYLSDLTVQGCVIVGNTTRYYGGAVHYDWGSYSTITNCTIIGNSAELKGGGIYCHRAHATLTNSILWDNTAGEGHEIALYDASAIAVSYSVVQGGPNEVWGWPMTWGDGNVDADPLLTADGHLLGDSPCYNAGDPNTSTEGAETDIDAEPRPMSGRIEIGADEFIDTDADGLPNWWESKYFGSTTAADPNDDPDGDARLNLQEYSLSSNPQRDDKFYVDPNGDDAWDGRALAWDGQHGPKATIQAAIDAVDLLAPYGIAVMVAPGTYTGDGNRDIRLRGLPIAVLSTDPNDPNVVAATIIDCQGTPAEPHRGFVFDYGEGLDSVLAGLTITGGYAAGSGSDKDGGGIFCDQSRPTIIKCTITSSHAQSRGGGIWLGACSPAIADCTISQNQADIDGGGLSCTQSYPTITNCSIGDNEAAQNGGGIYCEQSDPTFEDCNVTGNQAGSTAGGIYCYQSDPNIHNCTISGNSANGSGGGVYCNESSPEITDCTIIGNSTAGTGGGSQATTVVPPSPAALSAETRPPGPAGSPAPTPTR